MDDEGGQRDVAEAMRLFGLAAAQGHADAQEDLICSALTVTAEEDAQYIGERVRELACEVSARQAEEQRGGSAGVGSSTGHQAVLSTPPCSPSTRGDGEHVSGGRAPSAPGQISARKAARALLCDWSQSAVGKL